MVNKFRRLEKRTDRFEAPRVKRVTGESGSLANEPCVPARKLGGELKSTPFDTGSVESSDASRLQNQIGPRIRASGEKTRFSA